MKKLLAVALVAMLGMGQAWAQDVSAGGASAGAGEAAGTAAAVSQGTVVIVFLALTAVIVAVSYGSNDTTTQH